MANRKIDGVIEAVRYTSAGQLEFARAYQKRGASFSDRVLLSRDMLIKILKTGKHYVIGERLPYLASTFKTGQAVRLVKFAGGEILLAALISGEHDDLTPAPVL
jgi:hypothetical protein